MPQGISLSRVAIDCENGTWSAPPEYTAEEHHVSVTFVNNSDQDCRIFFSNRQTFATSFVGLPAQSSIAMGILVREPASYQIQPWSGPPGEINPELPTCAIRVSFR